MKLYINGDERQVDPGLTAQQLIEQMGLTGKRLAMEVNLEIVPRSQFADYRFNDGDRVEIVHAIGGG